MPERVTPHSYSYVKGLANRNDKICACLVEFFNQIYYVGLTKAVEGSNKIRVTGQMKDADGSTKTGVYEVLVRSRVPLKPNHTAVVLATVAALPACTAAGAGVGKTLTGTATARLSIDNVPVTTGNRVLVKNQVAAKDNGFYVVTEQGDDDPATAWVLTRATDFDAAGVDDIELGAKVLVTAGDTMINKTFVFNVDGTITVDGTTGTALNFVEYTTVTDFGAITAGSGKGTIQTGAGTAEIWVSTDANGQFDVDVKSLMVGKHLVEAECDNGETESLVLTFA